MTNPIREHYRATAKELVTRIRRLAAEKPEVLKLTDAWGLFDLGLKCSDLDPTLAQASFALREAQRLGPLHTETNPRWPRGDKP